MATASFTDDLIISVAMTHTKLCSPHNSRSSGAQPIPRSLQATSGNRSRSAQRENRVRRKELSQRQLPFLIQNYNPLPSPRQQPSVPCL